MANAKKVITNDQGIDSVLINHQDLNKLIGSLMHLLDLDSDVEHRDAVKSEVKSRSRAWLDEEYAKAGYKA